MVMDKGLLFLLLIIFGAIIAFGYLFFMLYINAVEKNRERIKAIKEFETELREIGIYMSKGIPVNWDEPAKPKLKLVVNNK